MSAINRHLLPPTLNTVWPPTMSADPKVFIISVGFFQSAASTTFTHLVNAFLILGKRLANSAILSSPAISTNSMFPKWEIIVKRKVALSSGLDRYAHWYAHSPFSRLATALHPP